MRNNFPQEQRISIALLKQMGVIYCYYWKYDFESNEDKCVNICTRLFASFLEKVSVTENWPIGIFVNSIAERLEESQFHDVFQKVISCFPVEEFLHLLMEISDVDRQGFMISSFLQIWLSCPKSLIGSTLLPFIDKTIPNNTIKCDYISKVIKFFHKTGLRSEDVISSFLYDLLKIQCQCNMKILLGRNVDLKAMVISNMHEILWRIFLDDDECSRKVLRESLLISESSSLEAMISLHIPDLIAKEMIKTKIELKKEVTFSLLDLSSITKIIKEKILQVYAKIIEYLSPYDDRDDNWNTFEIFEQLCSSVHKTYLDFSFDFNKWLIESPGRLMELMVEVVRKLDSGNTKNCSKIWCTLVKIFVSSKQYWNFSVNGLQIDGSISFLIIRHLNVMTINIDCGDLSKEIKVLSQLVTLAHNSVGDFNQDIHTLWHHQLFYFCSLYWKNIENYLEILSTIFNLLCDETRWSLSLKLLDQYILATEGFCDVPHIKLLIKEASFIESLTNFLYFYEVFDVFFFRYHRNFFKETSFIINSFSYSDCTDLGMNNLLQEYSHILPKFMTLFKKEIEVNIISSLMHLKVILPSLSFSEECNFTRKTTENPVLAGFFINCLNDFGNIAWLSYQFLCSAYKQDENSYLTGFFCLFPEKIIYSENDSINNVPLEIAHTFSKIVFDGVHQLFRTGIFDGSDVMKIILPYIGKFSASKLSLEEKKMAILSFNGVFTDSENYSEDIKKIGIQLILSLFCSDINNYIMKNFNLLAAAKVAYDKEMYTATLLILERMWIENNNQFITEDVIDLYENSYKLLGCQEELQAKRFLLTSNTSDTSESYQWLLSQGKFDILKQLLENEPKESDCLNHVKKVNILWKLSRWDDLETYEIKNLDCEDRENLILYDRLFSMSKHAMEKYRHCVAKLCTSSWDTETYLKPLIVLDTISRTIDSHQSSLSSLINISNKSNIGRLDSSITWNIVSLGRQSNGKEIIARNSMAICDMAVRCSRLDYIDLILDMFKDCEKGVSNVNCTGETACFRMVAVQKYWNKGDRGRCSLELENLIADCGNHLSSCKSVLVDHELLKRLYSCAVAELCQWNSIYPAHSANQIRTYFLDSALKIIAKDFIVDTHLLDAMANFSYQEYHNIDQYMHSAEYGTRLKILSESRRDINLLGNIESNNRLKGKLQKLSLLEEDDLGSLHNDRETFLVSAVLSCIECLEKSHQHDLKVFCLISMWFNNSDNNKINELISQIKDKVPSYKFLVLLPQLCARLTSDIESPFQRVLEKLIETILSDHPYHSLYNIFVLRNANKDTEVVNINAAKRQRVDNKMNGRIDAATKIIERLLKGSRRKIVKDVDLLTEAYIQLANTNMGNLTSKVQKNIAFPPKCDLLKICANIDLPNPLVHLPIDKSCKYPSNKLVKIVNFGNTFTLMSGINLPKVIICIGSDGIKRRQLIKGKDDLRQDSVMQQVFSVVNSLMKSSHSSDNCSLTIRTYKVIPTSKLSGVIEWCEGTIPLGDWLTDEKNGAHIKYRPDDLTPNNCKSILYKVKDQPIVNRVKVFKDIYSQIRPVLGYFLLENFPDPRQWFKARKTFTHSVANNSITGFILGLGDRHPQNILLDLKTAELIHIDFGIAFEQGRLLPTPERVPFRLTRDLVHAMGPFGVEGRFKETCCNVLSLLRLQKDIILTLTEVLLYDPLHYWSLTPQQARSLQAMRAADCADDSHNISISKSFMDSEKINKINEDQNKMAERVILELSRKLAGNVDNCCLNVEGHVNYLIQSATDIDNLARMYFGWQAYL